MTELISVQPAKPGDGSNTAYSGLSGVWYTDQERDTNTKVFFAVTMRTVVMPDGTANHGQMADAIEHMQQFINWHLDGLIEINESCIWRDPADQRPAGDTRKHYESNGAPPPASQTAREGEGYDRVVSIKRIFNTDGTAAYEVTPLFKDKPSKYPYSIKNARDVSSLESALREAGLNPDQWKVNNPYALTIDVTWTWGDPIPNNKRGARYKNDMQFTVMK